MDCGGLSGEFPVFPVLTPFNRGGNPDVFSDTNLAGRRLSISGTQGIVSLWRGGGYAGGIVSAAVDGVRVAQQIIGRYAPAGDKGKY